MTDELKPCPFCGGKAITNHVRDGRRAVCTDCGAAAGSQFHGPLTMPSAEDRAIAAWNSRAAQPAVALSYRDPLGLTRDILNEEDMRVAWSDITAHSRVWPSAARFLRQLGLIGGAS